MTNITITDSALLKQLADTDGPITFRDPSGNVVLMIDGRFGVPPAGSAPPFSKEELERQSRNREGRPLADILSDLREKHGS